MLFRNLKSEDVYPWISVSLKSLSWVDWRNRFCRCSVACAFWPRGLEANSEAKQLRSRVENTRDMFWHVSTKHVYKTKALGRLEQHSTPAPCHSHVASYTRRLSVNHYPAINTTAVTFSVVHAICCVVPVLILVCILSGGGSSWVSFHLLLVGDIVAE